MVHEIITESEKQTFNVGEGLGRSARPGSVYALYGDLGAGKTILAKGIARGMGICDEVTSPTFTLLEIYEGALPLYHFDLYRVESERELDFLGFDEYWEGDGVSVIEWGDRGESRLPEKAIKIRLEYAGPTQRKIRIECPDD